MGETLVRSFKPDEGVYRLVPMNLGIPVKNILMVACHKYDLAGARRFGFPTGYVHVRASWALLASATCSLRRLSR